MENISHTENPDSEEFRRRVPHCIGLSAHNAASETLTITPKGHFNQIENNPIHLFAQYAVARGNSQEVRMNCEGITSINSDAIADLVCMFRNGITVRLSGVSSHLREKLNVLNLAGTIFQIEDSLPGLNANAMEESVAS